MAVVFGADSLKKALSMKEIIDLLEKASIHEAAGRSMMSPKIHFDFESGFLRYLFAADYEAGYGASKAYHVVNGVARYVVTLYRLKDGEILALLDGRHITDLRTGGVSGVVARRVPIEGPVSLGIIGSGHQARAQLETLAAVYRIGACAVFSPTPANREGFARDLGQSLGIDITPVDSAEAAVRNRNVVVAASSARGKEPVLRGEWLDGCRLLCAVGNTRPQFAEADVACFARSSLVVLDTVHALEEAGELRQAKAAGKLPQAKLATLGQVATGAVPIPASGLVTFKSVGTALQDLALAGRYYELLGDRPDLPRASDLGVTE
jgi:ornithine cyclodeaminase/alanine dehydrogenase